MAVKPITGSNPPTPLVAPDDKEEIDRVAKIIALDLRLQSSENSPAYARRQLAQALETLDKQRRHSGSGSPGTEWSKHTGYSILAFSALTHLTTDLATVAATRTKLGRRLIGHFDRLEARKQIVVGNGFCGSPKTMKELTSVTGGLAARRVRWVVPAAAGVGLATYFYQERKGEKEEPTEAQLNKILQTTLSGKKPRKPIPTMGQMETMGVQELHRIQRDLVTEMSEVSEELRPIRASIERTNEAIAIYALKELPRDDLESLSQPQLKAPGEQLIKGGLNRKLSWFKDSGLSDLSSLAVGFGVGHSVGYALYKAFVPWDLDNRQRLHTISGEAYEDAREEVSQLVKEGKLWSCRRDQEPSNATDEGTEGVGQEAARRLDNAAKVGVAVTLGSAFLKFMAKRAVVAGALSVADGPLPVGEAAGVLLLIGSAVQFAFNAKEIAATY